MKTHHSFIKRPALATLIILVGFIFWHPSMATGPRVTPTIFVSDADKVFAVDNPPFVSGNVEGGLNIEVINAVFPSADIDNTVTTLPLQKMAKYYLQQENAIAILGHYLHFNPEERKELIFVPISAPLKHYFYYRPSHPDGMEWNGDLNSLMGATYGAHREEQTAAYKNAGIRVKKGSPRAIVQKLISGEVDFAGMPGLSAEWLIAKHFPKEREHLVQMKPAAGDIPGFLIFNRRHPQGKATADRFDKALTAFIDDGGYEKVLEKYMNKGANIDTYMKRFKTLRMKYRKK
ncbi:MAG: ABC transporter substrate-binding protein [Sedimenticola sp.]